MVYPRALVARHIYARTVAAWPSAEPTDKPPGRYPRVWCPRLPRDGTACHRAPPSRVTYSRALASPLPRDLSARDLAAGTIPACQRYPHDISPNLAAWHAHDTDTPSHKDYPQHGLAWRIPACRSRAGPSCAPNPNQTLGNPTLTEHLFEFAGPDRTPVRPNKCSTLHPAMLGKVTRITGNRFHSLPAFNRQAGRFQSSKDCQPETKPNRTLVLSHTCSTVVAVNRGKVPNIAKMVRHTAVSY
jgi:hypothetical protein